MTALAPLPVNIDGGLLSRVRRALSCPSARCLMPPLHVDKDVELVVLHRQVRILEQYPQFVAPASTPLRALPA